VLIDRFKPEEFLFEVFGLNLLVFSFQSRYILIYAGLTQTSILNNFRRSNERMGQTENKIVYIATLFNEEVHLVASAT
jgi:hypothetical protein